MPRQFLLSGPAEPNVHRLPEHQCGRWEDGQCSGKDSVCGNGEVAPVSYRLIPSAAGAARRAVRKPHPFGACSFLNAVPWQQFYAMPGSTATFKSGPSAAPSYGRLAARALLAALRLSRCDSEFRKCQRTARRIKTGSVCHLKIAGRVAILILSAASPLPPLATHPVGEASRAAFQNDSRQGDPSPQAPLFSTSSTNHCCFIKQDLHKMFIHSS